MKIYVLIFNRIRCM